MDLRLAPEELQKQTWMCPANLSIIQTAILVSIEGKFRGIKAINSS